VAREVEGEQEVRGGEEEVAEEEDEEEGEGEEDDDGGACLGEEPKGAPACREEGVGTPPGETGGAAAELRGKWGGRGTGRWRGGRAERGRERRGGRRSGVNTHRTSPQFVIRPIGHRMRLDCNHDILHERACAA
jgi:hypothetical protein